MLFTSRDVAELRTPGLAGRITVAQALARLLGGSDMTWHVTELPALETDIDAQATLKPVDTVAAVQEE